MIDSCQWLDSRPVVAVEVAANTIQRRKQQVTWESLTCSRVSSMDAGGFGVEVLGL
jgi:hypothetical protein